MAEKVKFQSPNSSENQLLDTKISEYTSSVNNEENEFPVDQTVEMSVSE